MHCRLLPIALLALIACSTDDEERDAEQACRDTADAVAKAAERCGQPYQANYDAFVRGAAEGDCANVKKVRDADALYETCIPSFATISCSELTEDGVDPSCKEQLQRPAS